jgi:bacterioferritin-associated ferredoxin
VDGKQPLPHGSPAEAGSYRACAKVGRTMNRICTHPNCEGCPIAGRVVCRCLQITEEVLFEAVMTLGLRTVREVRQHTGAGEGCTACHNRIREYLERHVYSSPSPSICSVK